MRGLGKLVAAVTSRDTAWFILCSYLWLGHPDRTDDMRRAYHRERSNRPGFLRGVHESIRLEVHLLLSRSKQVAALPPAAAALAVRPAGLARAAAGLPLELRGVATVAAGWTRGRAKPQVLPGVHRVTWMAPPACSGFHGLPFGARPSTSMLVPGSVPQFYRCTTSGSSW